MGTKAVLQESIETVRMLTAKEVLRLVGVSNTKLYEMISDKKNPIPSRKMGKSRRFPFDKVRAWMETLEK